MGEHKAKIQGDGEGMGESETMNDYKELVDALRCGAWSVYKVNSPAAMCETIYNAQIADAIEQLVREINYCPTDTLRKYHAWLLEQFRNNPTSEILHSIDTAIGWLKAYAEYRDINVSFGIKEWRGVRDE